jgi:hypothetical protein
MKAIGTCHEDENKCNMETCNEMGRSRIPISGYNRAMESKSGGMSRND